MNDFHSAESPIRIGDDADAIFAPPTDDERRSVSPLEGLRDALTGPVQTEPIVLRVPGRPGVTIRCHTSMSQEQRKAWQKRSTKKARGKDPEVDEMLFAQLVLANTCEAVLFNGAEALDEEGTPLTFAHKQLWDMVNAAEPSQSIRNLFGVDAHVLLASGEVLLASGFDDDLSDESDPTEAR